MRVRSKKSGQEETITPERWGRIQKNGFAAEFEVLPDHPMPDEVAERLEESQATEEKPVGKAKKQ